MKQLTQRQVGTSKVALDEDHGNMETNGKANAVAATKTVINIMAGTMALASTDMHGHIQQFLALAAHVANIGGRDPNAMEMLVDKDEGGIL